MITIFILDNIYKSFGDNEVLKDLSLDVKQNKIICILGPSGCGKTTLLNIMSGLLKPDKGKLVGFKNKNFSYIFQEPRLLKWKTVSENIEFILKNKLNKKEINTNIKKYLNVVKLYEFRNYYPDQLSGGMKQRVAIARAFAYPADILLMDEPFKSLDLDLKLNLIDYFLMSWNLKKLSVFFVTHDIHAALMLSDEIFILKSNPTKIKKHMINKIPPNERNLNNKEIISMEAEIFSLISNI